MALLWELDSKPNKGVFPQLPGRAALLAGADGRVVADDRWVMRVHPAVHPSGPSPSFLDNTCVLKHGAHSIYIRQARNQSFFRQSVASLSSDKSDEVAWWVLTLTRHVGTSPHHSTSYSLHGELLKSLQASS